MAINGRITVAPGSSGDPQGVERALLVGVLVSEGEVAVVLGCGRRRRPS